MLELTGADSRLVFQPLPQDDPRQRRPDLTRARTLLNWAPTVDLREGLTRTIAHFSNSSPVAADIISEQQTYVPV